jgi:soluble lytic murein transglycosylase-like protein
MGVGQVMPATAQALAARAGLPWQPSLMAGHDGASRQYQDSITNAALQEAWNAGKGDPAAAAMYYHGGSNHAIWGPKTHQYASDVLGRMVGI